ncbi:hypothetical protein [Streptomyces sp. NPDC093097]|uniref:hypothetical protein n=1 Tax=Streptomyces sp. NPDC093097 TaxID=3366027 RepID=UPI00381680FD
MLLVHSSPRARRRQASSRAARWAYNSMLAFSSRSVSLAECPFASMDSSPDSSSRKVFFLVSGSQGVDRDAQVEPDSRPGCHADNNVHRFELEFLDLTSLGTHVTEDLHGLLGDRRGNPEIDLLKLGPRFEPDHKVVIRTGHTATLLY